MPRRSAPPSPVAPLADAALVDALVQCGFTVMALLSRIGAGHDLSLTQMRALGVLRDRRPRMAELADFLGLDRSTMSGLIERAERRGLVARSRHVADGRAVEVFLTPDGTALASRIHGEVRAALASTAARLNTDERHALVTLLTRTLA